MTAADRPTVTDYPDADEVLDVIYEVGYAASSTVQRKLGLTFRQAEDVLAALGRCGIVGKAEGSLARKILVTRSEAEAILGMADPEAPAQAHPRPSVTDDARAEAAAALRATVDLDPRSDFDRGYAHGWHAAAEWAAAHAETTTTTTHECDSGDFDRTICDCGAMHSYCTSCGTRQDDCPHGTTTATTEDVQERAELVMARVDEQQRNGEPATVAQLAQALADAGLLARTRPTRDDLARAIASGCDPDHPAPNRHDYRAADAVLALLRGGA